MDKNEQERIVCVSGGFDPIHKGHIAMLMGAAHFGKLVVILNSDNWLLSRKGYVLMPWTDRKEILLGIKNVVRVVSVDDSDGTVCSALEKIKPAVFANGGLRTSENTPEKELCEKLGIKMIWGIGGAAKDDITLDIRNRILGIPKNLPFIIKILLN